MTIRHRRINGDSGPFIAHLGKLSETTERLCLLAIAGALLLVSGTFIQGCTTQDPEVPAAREQRRLFQPEQDTETHGRKDWFDRVIEVGPGKLEVEMAGDC
jgi:hypothetical protein